MKSTSRNTITVSVNGASRTFKDGEGFTLPKNVGGKRTITADQVEFVGHGAVLPALKVDDYAGRVSRARWWCTWARVVRRAARPRTIAGSWGAAPAMRPMSRRRLAPSVPSFLRPSARPRPPHLRLAAPSPSASPAAGGPGGGGGRGGFGQPLPASDFTTVERLDKTIPPAVTAQDEFFEFLFSGAEVKYADLKAKAAAQEPLPAVSLKGVSITINLDTDYQVVSNT